MNKCMFFTGTTALTCLMFSSGVYRKLRQSDIKGRVKSFCEKIFKNPFRMFYGNPELWGIPVLDIIFVAVAIGGIIWITWFSHGGNHQ